MAGQSADTGIGRRAGNPPGGIAGGYDGGAVVKPRQPADPDVGNRSSVHRYPGVGGADRANVLAHQPAQIQPAGTGDRAARSVAGGDLAGVAARQHAHQTPAAAHDGVKHPQIPDHPVAAQETEQPGNAGGADGHIADGIPAAVKHCGVCPPDRRPVGVVIPRAHAPAVVGVEIQIRRQFVAQPPHYRRIPPAECRVIGRDAGFRRPVAVQIPPDGVQLRQRIHLGQPVVVRVVGGERPPRPLRRGVQQRVLPGGAETPGVIPGIVAVDRYIPLGVDAGVAGGRLQLGGGLALRGDAGAAGFAADAGRGRGLHRSVAIAGGYRRAAALNPSRQSADTGIGRRAGHPPRGIAGDDCSAAVKARQPADPDAAPRSSVDRYRGVAGLDRAYILADQPPQILGAGNGAARGVAGADHAVGLDLPGQYPENCPAAAHLRINHPHIPDHPAAAQDVEQPPVQRPADGQVADGMPVAVKHRGVSSPDGRPVGVGIRGGHRHPVGGEVQIRIQFVPGAVPRRAAHPAAGGPVVAGERPEIAGGRRGCGNPVAVQIPADGVQLIQVADLDQPIVVAIVVNHPLVGGVQRRVLGGGAEVPGVVHESIPVQIDVPIFVDAGVAGGRLQLRRGVAGGGDAGGAGIADARSRRAMHRIVAVAVGDHAGAADDPAHQSAHIGVVSGARHRARGIAGDD